MEGFENRYENLTEPVNMNKPKGKILLAKYAEKCHLKILPGIQEIIDMYSENNGKTLNISQKREYIDFKGGVERECRNIKEYMSTGKSKLPVDVAYIQYAESVVDRWHSDYAKFNKNNTSRSMNNSASVMSGVSTASNPKAPRRARKGRKTRKSRKSRRNTRKN